MVFEKNKIVRVDVGAYAAWYTEHVQALVLWEDYEAYVVDPEVNSENTSNIKAIHLHELTGSIGCWAVPVRFIQKTGRFYVEESNKETE